MNDMPDRVVMSIRVAVDYSMTPKFNVVLSVLRISNMRGSNQAEVGDVGNLPWTLPSTPEEIACHKKIATFVRDQVLKLEARARRDYFGVDPSSPYSTVGSEASPASA